MCGCGNRGLASPMSFRRQSDHRRGGRWPSLTKPWRSGIVQDQNERKLELSLGPLRERHPQPGRAGHVSRVRSPHAKRGSASPLSRGPGSCWAGWSKASWERQLCLLPTPGLPSQPSEVPATNFPPKTIESRPDTGFSPDTGFQLPKTGCENRHAPLSFTCALR